MKTVDITQPGFWYSLADEAEAAGLLRRYRCTLAGREHHNCPTASDTPSCENPLDAMRLSGVDGIPAAPGGRGFWGPRGQGYAERSAEERIALRMFVAERIRQ